MENAPRTILYLSRLHFRIVVRFLILFHGVLLGFKGSYGIYFHFGDLGDLSVVWGDSSGDFTACYCY